MMRNIALCFVAVTLLFSVQGVRAATSPFDVDGVVPGKWTMDLDAAKKMAKERGLPLLLNFTGSDWCGWCKLMDSRVFSKSQWKDYAASNIVLVALDFPQDKTLVPEKYVARNNSLKDKYGIEGYPTYIVLDQDGETPLGSLAPGRDKTAESFIRELAAVLRYSAAGVAAYIKTLNPEDKAAYEKLVAQIAESKKAILDQEQQITAAQEKIVGIRKKLGEVKDSAAEFRAARLGANDLKLLKDGRAKIEAKTKELSDWIASQPERSPENEKKYQAMVSEIQDLSSRLAEY